MYHIKYIEDWKVQSDSSVLPLNIPERCPMSLRTIFTKCWRYSPGERCSFEEIVSMIEKEISNFSEPLEGE